jgi:hypothetical protein
LRRLDEFAVTSVVGEGGDLADMLHLKDEIKEERIVLVPKFRPRAVDGTRDCKVRSRDTVPRKL